MMRKETNAADTILVRPVAHIRSDFHEKFGIPRQSGLAHTEAEIILEPEFSDPDCVRGLEGFSHIWLIWGFSSNSGKPWHMTVRPPRLGGNTRVGVFASRSPFRPNGLGMSCVRLLSVHTPEREDEGESRKPAGGNACPSADSGRIVIKVEGADLLDGTPIYDIKPYIPYADCIPHADGGYTDTVPRTRLRVNIPEEIAASVSPSKLPGLIDVLAEDPRPSYQNDPDRVYGVLFAGMNVRFRVAEDTLTVIAVH